MSSTPELAPEGTCAIVIRAPEGGHGLWASLARGLAMARSHHADNWDPSDEASHASTCRELFLGTMREMMCTALKDHKVQQKIESHVRKSLEPGNHHPPHDKIREPLNTFVTEAAQQDFFARSFALAHVLGCDENDMQSGWAPPWLAPWAACHTDAQIHLYCAPAGLGCDSGEAVVHYVSSHHKPATVASDAASSGQPPPPVIRLVHTKGDDAEWGLLVADTADSLPPIGHTTPFKVLVDPVNATRCKACAKRLARAV